MSLDWPELLVASVLASAAFFVGALYFLKRQRAGASEAELAAIRQELAELRQRLETLERQGDHGGEEEPDASRSVYEYAIQYARQGLAAVEIAARCGISRDEAALIVALHQKTATRG
jgi:hypothetical protein